MKKLQPREKIMLVVLVLIAIIFLPGYFLIGPMIQSNADLEAQLADLSMRRQDLEIASMSNADLKETINGLQLQVAEEEQKVPSRLKSYDMHYTVEDICKKNGVTLKSLNIDEYEPVIVTGEDGAAVSQADIVYKAKLSVSFSSGDIDSIVDALDALGKNEYAVLNDCTLSIPEARQALPAQLAEEKATSEAIAEVDANTDTDVEAATQESTAPTTTPAAGNEQMIECSAAFYIYAVLQPGDPDFDAAVQVANAEAQTNDAEEEAAAEE